jgi:hypothetical protein
MASDCDVSVVMPFADDEDRVGVLARRVAAYLRAQKLSFEVLAADEGSGDNSVLVLSLVAAEVPELRVIRSTPHHGCSAGASVARGRTIWFVDPTRADASLAPFGRAHDRLVGGAADVIAIDGRWVVCRRSRAWRALASLRGRAAVFDRRLVRRATLYGLFVESSSHLPIPRVHQLAGALTRAIR